MGVRVFVCVCALTRGTIEMVSFLKSALQSRKALLTCTHSGPHCALCKRYRPRREERGAGRTGRGAGGWHDAPIWLSKGRTGQSEPRALSDS